MWKRTPTRKTRLPITTRTRKILGKNIKKGIDKPPGWVYNEITKGKEKEIKKWHLT
jgi:hypothetical protein